MTAKLDITENQIKALCRGAEKVGYVPVIQIGKVFVRLIPEEHAINISTDSPLGNDEEIDL